MKKAVFLDKDGTLVNDVAYNVDVTKIELTQQSIEGLLVLQKAGYLLIIISNQAGLAHGYFSEFALIRANEYLESLLKEHGIQINAAYYCPHHPEGHVRGLSMDCSCRKPKPGLLMTAAKDLNIDLTSSWMIGDILHDVEAGNRAGCRTVLVDNGNETEWVTGAWRQPFAHVSSINEAASFIIHHTASAHAKLEGLSKPALR